MKKLTKEEYELCNKIVNRAIEMKLYSENERVGAMLDITNATTYFNMKLKEWLEAESFDFAHDVCGIMIAVDRMASPVNFNNDRFWLPRFAGEDK